MTYIVATRNPNDDDAPIIFLSIMAEQRPKEFDNFNKAKKYAEEHPVTSAWGYDIVEVNV